jgi:hypothetical protein
LLLLWHTYELGKNRYLVNDLMIDSVFVLLKRYEGEEQIIVYIDSLVFLYGELWPLPTVH